MKQLKNIDEVWSLIPARSGSKSIKNKNLMKINGKSLIARAALISRKSKFINRTFISTDSRKYKNEALKFKIEAPFLRTKKNSRDKSTDFDVINEFIKSIYALEKKIPKYLVYLRPTSPLRKSEIIDKAIIKFKKLKNYDSLVSVHEMAEPAYKKYLIKNKNLKSVIPNFSIDRSNEPRQNFPKTYTLNGYIDIIKTKNIFKNKYLNKKSFPFIIQKTIDIDDINDFKLAKKIYENK